MNRMKEGERGCVRRSDTEGKRGMISLKCELTCCTSISIVCLVVVLCSVFTSFFSQSESEDNTPARTTAAVP